MSQQQHPPFTCWVEFCNKKDELTFENTANYNRLIPVIRGSKQLAVGDGSIDLFSDAAKTIQLDVETPVDRNLQRIYVATTQPQQAPQTPTQEVASELEFWRTLHSASIDPAVNILSLPVGVHFMGHNVNRSSIYVRDCYVELKDQIYAEFDQYEVNSTSTSTPTTASKNAFVITSNPGTGKSCFLFYIMYLIARVKGTMVVHSIHAQIADSYYLYTYVGGIPVVRLGPMSDFITLLCLRSTFFLVDSKEETNFAAKTIIVSSPDPMIYKEFLKNVGTTRRYMPPWFKSELDHVRPILYPNVTQNALDASSQCQIENAISTINLNLCVESIGKEVPIAPGSHKVIQIIPYEQAALPKYASMKLQFSSKYVAERVVKAVEAVDINSVVKQLHVHKFLHSPLGGSFFESFAHRLLQQGGVFDRRNLTTTATDKITFTPTVSSTLCSIADIGLSPPNKYLLPNFDNFPAIDKEEESFQDIQASEESHPVCVVD
ncbi:hypothetical protein PPL_06629 [Heterostelium album PN500]|uniref:Uncharacterized protein n=1 Tax=Heterostelium pallidum (strain ATCC 26659 / Pp 5 / PN500) TaxID=670386 RepID=D3BF96_HETP5|nr:hypothetical protein PPL_06629 [Heterostelium album PN500]EFA79810.1 hypothetical protein PPL_06629 [Heterostelium album PN500]|eukprot:XP_020431931.1 hypothetical protein PPL_06629 [Heterostelium album PN500]